MLHAQDKVQSPYPQSREMGPEGQCCCLFLFVCFDSYFFFKKDWHARPSKKVDFSCPKGGGEQEQGRVLKSVETTDVYCKLNTVFHIVEKMLKRKKPQRESAVMEDLECSIYFKSSKVLRVGFISPIFRSLKAMRQPRHWMQASLRIHEEQTPFPKFNSSQDETDCFVEEPFSEGIY